jgi:hypothetical protein
MADILQFPDNHQRKVQQVKEQLRNYNEDVTVAAISEWVRSYTLPALTEAADDMDLDVETTPAAEVAALYFLKLKSIWCDVMASGVEENIDKLYKSIETIVEEDFVEDQLDDILAAKVFGAEPD